MHTEQTGQGHAARETSKALDAIFTTVWKINNRLPRDVCIAYGHSVCARVRAQIRFGVSIHGNRYSLL